MQQPKTKKSSKSRVAFNLTVLGAIVGMGIHIAVVAMGDARLNGDLRIARLEGQRLYEAFERYRRGHGSYPSAFEGASFQLDSFEPFKRRGYYSGGVQTILLDRRADAYGNSPLSREPEFWLEMTLRRDPAVRLLIARSDSAPMSGGRWMDGVYVFRNGRLEPLR